MSALPPTYPRETPASQKPRVLVVDDDPDVLHTLSATLRRQGYAVREASSALDALTLLERFVPHVVLTDLWMPDLDGIELIEQGQQRARQRTAFIVMTGQGTVTTAVAAMKKGAEDYLMKPFDDPELFATVQRAWNKARPSPEDAWTYDGDRPFAEIIGEHPSMRQLFRQIALVARSGATVLISGESGTGKEQIASAIHRHSSRRDRPFVRLNCAALAGSLLESELFGHERGSFTGATERREGRFFQAHGSTLFLDEVSEIPMPAQVKLLRFLQEGEFERVGGNKTVRVDTRIVAASNRDLSKLVRKGAFREDLFYRLNVVPLVVPPLRARASDIPVLAQAFLKRFAAESRLEVRGFTPQALERLLGYPWPGNVRELENAVERAVVMSTQELIGVEDLALTASGVWPSDLGLSIPGSTLSEVERIVILKTLEATHGSPGRAAKILGISRRKIQYRIKEWAATASHTRASRTA